MLSLSPDEALVGFGWQSPSIPFAFSPAPTPIKPMMTSTTSSPSFDDVGVGAGVGVAWGLGGGGSVAHPAAGSVDSHPGRSHRVIHSASEVSPKLIAQFATRAPQFWLVMVYSVGLKGSLLGISIEPPALPSANAAHSAGPLQ
jgi:hypothetical protein